MVAALNQLSISSIVNVDVILTPQAAQAQSLSNLLLLSNNGNVIDVLERYRIYTSAAQVLADFASGRETQAAAAWFGQNPKPKQMYIGRWARGPANAQFRGAIGVSTSKTIPQWQAITDGSFQATLNGGSPQNFTAMNFSAVQDLNGVASVINSAFTGTTFTYNAVYDRFEANTTANGASTSISFLSNAPSGTPIANALFMGVNAAPAAYTVPGMAAESASKVTALFDALIGRQWYGLASSFQSDSDAFLFVQAIQALQNKHLFFYTDANPVTLSNPGVDTTSAAYILNQTKADRAFVQYDSVDPFAALSAAARLLGVNYNGSNTALTLMFKQEPGQTPENLTATQAAALKAKACNVFAAYDNGTAILQYGQMSSGIYADQITAADWLATTIETAQYNAVYTSTTKIAQTDAGMHLLQTISEGVCSQAVRNGISAPGVWQSDGFGILQYGDFMPKGFYVYQGKVADQSVADRAARKATFQQVAVKLAGAVHETDVLVTINP